MDNILAISFSVLYKVVQIKSSQAKVYLYSTFKITTVDKRKAINIFTVCTIGKVNEVNERICEAGTVLKLDSNEIIGLQSL